MTALTSCTARAGIAVSGSDQAVVLHVARCDSTELVSEVRLATVGANKIADDSDDRILWEARADGAGAPLDAMTVGTQPPGMVQTVPLTEPLQPEQEYYGLIDSGLRGTTHFRPAELQADRVLYESRLEPVDMFRKSALSGGKCASGVSNGQVLVRSVGLLCLIGAAIGLALLVGRRRSRTVGPGSPD